jgi:hypothetical protein
VLGVKNGESWWYIGKNGEVLLDRPKPTVACSANGKEEALTNCSLKSLQNLFSLRYEMKFIYTHNVAGRSQWPRGLKRRSAAARLLRLWVRIPPGHGRLSVVNVVCCQVDVSAMSWLLVQRSPTDCGTSLCVI